ncbi:MAG TPA: hypothetical protein VFA11_10780 [Acidimicrobiales bacterium]|nr:hypothetical protein [Acidimicrobiales bacterium]
MRRWIVAGAALAMVAPGGAALANGGPPPQAQYGLCNAANNGQKNGQPWQNGGPTPFQQLNNQLDQQYPDSGSGDGTPENSLQDLQNDCNNANPQPGGK